jgi:hypothetical protein
MEKLNGMPSTASVNLAPVLKHENRSAAWFFSKVKAA